MSKDPKQIANGEAQYAYRPHTREVVIRIQDGKFEIHLSEREAIRLAAYINSITTPTTPNSTPTQELV